MPLERRPLTRRTALSLTGGVALSAAFGSVGALGRKIGDRSDTERADAIGGILFERIGRHETGQFDGGAEDIAYHSASQRLFVVDTANGVTNVLSASDPSDLTQEGVLAARDAFEAAGTTTSIDISRDTVAVVATHKRRHQPGRVIVYDAETLAMRATVRVGPTPDMVTFTPDGTRLLVANVGSTDRAGGNGAASDPRGSVSVIDLRDKSERERSSCSRSVPQNIGNHAVETATFEPFDGREDELRGEGVRIYANSGTQSASRNLEPAYIAPTADSRSAFVSLQVNNALAKLDVKSATFTAIIGLGTTDFSEEGNALATSTVDGETHVLTANEGASCGFEEVQVTDLDLATDGFDLSEFPVDSVEDLKKRREHRIFDSNGPTGQSRW